jgi:hypothetical protein
LIPSWEHPVITSRPLHYKNRNEQDILGTGGIKAAHNVPNGNSGNVFDKSQINLQIRDGEGKMHVRYAMETKRMSFES